MGRAPTCRLGLLYKDARRSLTTWRAGEQWRLLDCDISLKLDCYLAEASGFTSSPSASTIPAFVQPPLERIPSAEAVVLAGIVSVAR